MRFVCVRAAVNVLAACICLNCFADSQQVDPGRLQQQTAAFRAAPTREGARVRRAMLEAVAPSDPKAVIAQSLTIEEHAALPADVRLESEQPISTTGELEVLCAMPLAGSSDAPSILRFVTLADGRRFPAVVYGRRTRETCKAQIPINGVILNGTLILDENAIEEVDPAQISSVTAVTDATGATKTTATATVIGRIGGRLFRFRDREALKQAETKIQAAEASTNPTTVPFDRTITEPTAAAAETNTWATGPKTALVIRVDFSDKPGAPYTTEYCQRLMDTEVDPYYQSASYGQTSITTTVAEKTYRLANTAASYATINNYSAIVSEARALVKADFPNSYDRYLVIFADLSVIPGSRFTWSGMAGIGGDASWYNGYFDQRVSTHELGHNCGAGHANAWTATDGNPISSSGTRIEYGDIYDPQGDVMGRTSDFNPSFKRTFGWVTSAQIKPVTTSGSYQVRAFDHNAPSPFDTIALTIKTSATTYYISYRSAWTPENTSNSPSPNIQRGAYIIRTTNGGNTEILDMTPATTSRNDAALLPGATFVDADAGFSVRTLSITGTGKDKLLNVEISFIDPKRLPTFTVGDAAFGSTTDIKVQTTTPPQRTQLYIDGVLWQETSAANPTFNWEPNGLGSHTVAIKTCYSDGNDVTNSQTVNVATPSNWTWITPRFQGNQANGLTFALNQWWAIADYGQLMSSPDGCTWTIRPFPTKASLTSIATDGTQILVVSQNYDAVGITTPSFWRTTDGATWAEAKTPAATVQKVYYSNKTWVAFANYSGLMTSTDGFTWTKPNSPFKETPQYLTYGNGTWVITTSTEIHSSTDLITWAKAPFALSGSYWQGGAAYANGQWIFTFYGTYGANATRRWVCLSTTDLKTFTEVNAGLDESPSCVTAIDGQFIICIYSYIHTSTDGQTWTKNKAYNTRYTALAKGNGTYVGAGIHGVMYTGISVTGMTADSNLRISINALTTTPNGTPLLGTNGYDITNNTPYAGIVTFEDGVIKTTNNIFNVATIAYRNGTYVAFGGHSRNVYTSSDGLTWTTRTTSIDSSMQAVVGTASGFAAVGYGGIAITSPDGITWTPRTTPTTNDLRALAVSTNGTALVAVGAKATTLLSTDAGATWKTISPGITSDPYNVVWQDGIGFCMTSTTNLFTSPDGATWTKTDTGKYWFQICSSRYGLILSGPGVYGITPNGTDISIGYLPTSIARIFFVNDTLFASANGVLTLQLQPPSPKPLSITTQPSSVTTYEGQSTSFCVETSGSGPLTYQWYRNGTTISGATTSILTVDAAKSTGGTYTVSIKNPAGTVTSSPATLTIDDSPIQIVTGLTPQTPLIGANTTLSINVTVKDGSTLTYQWFKNGTAIDGATQAFLNLATTAQTYGRYTVKITAGSASITTTTTISPPAAIQSSASSLNIAHNTTYALTVQDPLPDLAYQWFKNGTPIPGAITGTLIAKTGTTDATEAITVRASINGLSTDSQPVTITTTNDNLGRLVNVSVLTYSGAGDQALTIGLVSDGTKPVLIRAIGPSLTRFGVTDVLPDPRLTLYFGQTIIGTNEDWGGGSDLANTFSATGAFPLEPVTRDAAMTAHVDGLYTARVTGTNSATGKALLEVYDITANDPSAPRLINLSCRAIVGPDERKLTAGFMINGSTAKTVLIRAAGPALAGFGLSGTLNDPKLVLNAGQTVIAANDDWGRTVPANAFSLVGAFPMTNTASKDAALLITLPPGLYTAEISPTDNASSGLALVEVYELP